MTIKDLRALVDNLEEYIHVPGGIERLKRTILHLAVSGQLVPQDPSEGTGQELCDQIHAQKSKLITEGKLKKQKPLIQVAGNGVPFIIPRSWKWERLGEITQRIGSGSTPRGGKSVYTTDGPIFLRSQNVWNEGLRLGRVAHISSETYESMKNTRVYAHDVLLNITGASIGRTAFVSMGIGEANVSQHVSIVRPVLPEQTQMMHLCFTSSYFQNLIDSAQVGVSREGLSKEKLQYFYVPVPPLLEQQRIVEKTTRIFGLIDELSTEYKAEQEERRKLVTSSFSKLSIGKSTLALDMLTDIIRTKQDASEIRRTILRLAVCGQLVPQDLSEGTGQQLYDQIQAQKSKLVAEGKLRNQKSLAAITDDEIPFRIPDNWKWVRLANATVFSIGRTPARKEGSYWDDEFMPWVSIADLKPGQSINTTKERISKKAFDKCFSKGAVPAGSLLYSFKLTIGKMSITEMDAVHNEAIASFSTYSDEMTHYLFKALEVIDPTKRSKGAIMGNTLNSASLSLLEIPLPPLAEQARIVKKATQLLELVSKLESCLD